MAWVQLYPDNSFFEQYEICTDAPHQVRKKEYSLKGRYGTEYTRGAKELKVKRSMGSTYEYYCFKNGNERKFIRVAKVVVDHFPNKGKATVELTKQEAARLFNLLTHAKKDISYKWHSSLDDAKNKIFDLI